MQLKRNRVGSNGISDLVGLIEIPSLGLDIFFEVVSNLVNFFFFLGYRVLDLSENRIEDENVLEEIFVKMPVVAVLYLQGNGCVIYIHKMSSDF